jgi:MinD superfamily P-loop ATPase
MTDSRLKLFISHGDKGGTGKSMAAAIALDHSLVTGTPVLLVEGDAGIPDLALRFRGGGALGRRG